MFSTLKRALMTSQRALFLVDVEREVDLDHLGGLVHAAAAQSRQEDAGLGHVRVAVRLRLCAVLPATHVQPCTLYEYMSGCSHLCRLSADIDLLQPPHFCGLTLAARLVS